MCVCLCLCACVFVCVRYSVIQAKWLSAADVRGTSDPYCVLQLVNSRRQTQTDYKTVCPQWNRTFTLYVLPYTDTQASDHVNITRVE